MSNPCFESLKSALEIIEQASIMGQYAYKQKITTSDMENVDSHLKSISHHLDKIEGDKVVYGLKEYQDGINTAIDTIRNDLKQRQSEFRFMTGDRTENALAAIRGYGRDLIGESICQCFKERR